MHRCVCPCRCYALCTALEHCALATIRLRRDRRAPRQRRVLVAQGFLRSRIKKLVAEKSTFCDTEGMTKQPRKQAYAPAAVTAMFSASSPSRFRYWLSVLPASGQAKWQNAASTASSASGFCSYTTTPSHDPLYLWRICAVSLLFTSTSEVCRNWRRAAVVLTCLLRLCLGY